MHKMNKLGTEILVMLITVATFLTVISGSCNASDAKLPKTMVWSAYTVGSSGYAQASAIANAISKKYQTRIRILPSGTSIGRMMPLTSKKVISGFLATEVYFACEGLYDFATYEWGPQDLRVILAHPSSHVLITTKKSGIKTLKDLKGKRVAWIVGNPSVNEKVTGYLAFAGLTRQDVKRVEFTGVVASIRALMADKVDACGGITTAGVCYELANSPKGIHYLEFPPDDQEGWRRMMKKLPFFSPNPIKETNGAGLSKDNPVWLPHYRFPIITVYADADPEFVYNFTKALDQSFTLYEKSFATMDHWRIKEAGVPPADAPYHEGAIRYLKEKGIWTGNHDKWNADRINHIRKLQIAWEKAFEAGTLGKMKPKAFTQYWLKERKKALSIVD